MNEILDFLCQPLVLPMTIALAAGVAAYVLSRWPVAAKALALAAAVGVLVAAVGIAGLGPNKSAKTWQWIDLGAGLELNLELAATTLGMVVLFGAAGFALLITIYSFRAMAGHPYEGKFYACVALTLGGASIVALAGNLIVLLVGWELVTLMLFLMVGQGGKRAGAAAAKTYGILGFADACLLLAVALLIGAKGTGSLSFASGPVSIADVGAVGYVVYLLIMAAALAKAGAVPLHTWIPAAGADAPTPAVAYVPAALDKLLGIYLLAVLSLVMFKPDWPMQVVMMTIGGVTIITAVLMAMMQHNLKKLLSFHAVSQVGYMVLGIGTGTTIGVIGGLFHMINNAIYKSNLFLMSHTVGQAVGSDEIEDMGGLGRLLPITFICGAISAAAISGVPPFNGFVSKWLVYQGTLEVTAGRGLAMTMLVIAVFGSALTLASFVKVIHSAFLSPAPKALADRPPIRENIFLAAPMVVLALLCVVLGLRPELAVELALRPAIAGATTSGGAVTALDGVVETPVGVWGPTPAMWLILIGALLGVALVWIATRPGKGRVGRPFLGGEGPLPASATAASPHCPAGEAERFRTPGTHFYLTIANMPCIGPLLKHGGQGAMDVYHWSARHGKTFVEMLRSMHTGLLNLYVAWVLLGLIVTLTYLLLSTGT